MQLLIRFAHSSFRQGSFSSTIGRSENIRLELGRRLWRLLHVVGKNSTSLVPISINFRIVPIIGRFIDENVRKSAGVPSSNVYVFPSTQSDEHICGTAEIGDICNQLTLSKPITATLIRHFVASKFGESLSLTEQDKTVYNNHFGHYKDINESIYHQKVMALLFALL